jgi:hypothetical protein
MSIYDQIPKGEPLTRARLIAAIEHIKLLCESDRNTDVKLDLIHGLTCDLVEEWEQECHHDQELRDAGNSSDLKYRMWRINQEKESKS